ncbi:MAG: hypothetical protein KatS3mg118_2125 [Paracoccaceae bacterium]|nr:MAG: hypothetical protein KatS3mg118_2125 [Paracoccaceae bacterium]
MRLWRRMRETSSPSRRGKPSSATRILRAEYVKARGKGGFVRASWDEATEMIAAANAWTIRTYGPDRIFGFSPIPAMSMVSYAAGSRYLSLLGGACRLVLRLVLRPAAIKPPMTWGEQTDVPESADWYNAGYLLLWGSNVPQTRTPDAHFYTEARYRGAKSVVICPDYSEAAKFGDVWLNVKQGTDAALAIAFGHVILREFHLDRQVELFRGLLSAATPTFPMLVRLEKNAAAGCVPGRLPARRRVRGRPRRDQQPRLEDGRDRRGDSGDHRRARAARSATAGARPAAGTSRRRPAPAATCG